VADETLRFDIIGNDKASGAFSRVGREAEGMGAKMDYADRQARALDRSLDRLNHKTVSVKVDVNRTLKGTDRTLFDAERLLSGGGGGTGGIGGAASAGGFALPAAAGLVNPYTIAAALAASPFLGAGVGGTVLGTLGAGIAGLGIFGAVSTGKAPAAVAASQLAAAQARLLTSQAALNKLQGSGKATAAQLATATAGIAVAQDNLNKLQEQSADSKAWQAQNKGALQVKAAFGNLVTTAETDLRLISVPFQSVLINIANAFRQVLPSVMQPLSIAFQTMAPAVQLIGTTLAKSFANPAVAAAINEVGIAFTKFLKAFAPQIPGIVDALAKGVLGLAQAFTDHPGMINAMSSILAFLFRLPGYALGALGSLARVANWISTGFPHAVSRGLDATRIFFVNFGRDIYNFFATLGHTIATAWDTIWNNTVGRVQRGEHDVITWFGKLPAGIMHALTGLGADLWGYGKTVINDFWTGLKNIWGSVWNWFANIPKDILHALGVRSPPKWALEAGEHILQGLFGWTTAKKHQILARVSTLGAQVGAAAAASAARIGSGTVGTEQRYAAQLLTGYGWGQDQLGPLIALWNRESGWNPYAQNPSSGAAGIPQNIQGWSAYAPGDWAGQIRWGLDYIFGRYGSPAAAWGHEMQFGWYDRGGFLPPGLSLAYNTTGRPEPVGMAAGNTYNITVNVPPTVNPREAGRQVAQLILAHTKNGGRLYPHGVTPA
jgi:hypothetical protein